MQPSAWPTASLLVITLGATAGCLDEYRPEFHPETTVRYVQNVSYPTIVVQPIAPPGPTAPDAGAAAAAAAAARTPVRSPTAARPAPAWARSEPPETSAYAPAATPGEPLAASAGPSTRPPAGRPSPRPADTEVDAKLSAACLNDDAAACRTLAAMHLGQDAARPAPQPAAGAPLDRAVRTLVRHLEWAALTDSREGARAGLRAVF
jgi:hypothetical protein